MADRVRVAAPEDGTLALYRFDGWCWSRVNETAAWPAVSIVGHWNGFAVPRVTLSVREEIAAWLDVEGVDDAGAELRDIPPDSDGLVTLRGWAFSTQ